MATVVVVLIFALLVWLVVSTIRTRGRGLVSRRGTGIEADLGAMAGRPTVRVRSVLAVGGDRVELVLGNDPSSTTPGTGDAETEDTHLVVFLDANDFAFEQLHHWRRDGTELAMVMPPGSHILRLRSVDELQPVTLRLAGD